uniref:Probable transcriptional regulatory protein ENT37_08080 n=1 Tax=Anaerolinea thermolimosa TaxID=229919 RepID=A0A7C4KI48_9CHLR
MLTLFANGACGDVNHIDVRWAAPQSGPQEANRIGTILAAAVLSAYAQLQPANNTTLRVRAETLQLALPEISEAALDRARENNMPKENIERAIKRGTGESKEGFNFEQVFYEGYGPHGVALMIECMTENRNRTVAEVRHILTRSGGSMGEAGSVAWQFSRAAYFAVPAAGNDFDKIFELAVEGGADDVVQDGDTIEIYAPVENFKLMGDALRNAKIEIEEAELRMIPLNEVELPVDQALQVLRTIEMIEELDDVQNVYHTLRLSDEAIAALESEA